jgi:hypothetical protein
MPPMNRARQAPEIVTGLRSPDKMDARLGTATTDGRERGGDQADVKDNIPQVGKINPRHLEPLAPIHERKIFKFRSRNRFHTVLLEAYPDHMLPNGRVEKGYTVLAKFKDGEYTTTDRHHAEILTENPNYGMHGDYWDAEHEDQAAALATYNMFRDEVRSNPALFQRFMQDMAAGDFDVQAIAAQEAVIGEGSGDASRITQSNSQNTDGLQRGEA